VAQSSVRNSSVQRKAGSVGRVVIFLMVFAIITFTGFFFAAAAEHGPDWYAYVSYVLIPPIPAVYALFQKVFHQHYLTDTQNNLALLLGLLGQVVYCCVLMGLARRLFARLRRTPGPVMQEDGK